MNDYLLFFLDFWSMKYSDKIAAKMAIWHQQEIEDGLSITSGKKYKHSPFWNNLQKWLSLGIF